MPDDRTLKDKIFCRMHGKDIAKTYSVNDALDKLDKLVWKMANNFHKKVPHLDIDDLYQQGRMGILVSWQKFNENSGTAFITYANWWILKFIQTFCSAMEYSLTLNSQNQKLYKEMCINQGLTGGAEAMPKKGSRNDALAMLAKTNNNFTKKLDKDEFSEEDEDLEKMEINTSSGATLDKLLAKLKETLPAREFFVVAASAGLLHPEPLSVSEISEKLDVNKEFVRKTKLQHEGLIVSTLANMYQ